MKPSDHWVSELEKDARNPHSSRDFRKDIIPSLIPSGGVYAYPFRDPLTGRQPYWRELGTEIEQDATENAARFHVTPNGVVLVAPEMLGKP